MSNFSCNRKAVVEGRFFGGGFYIKRFRPFLWFTRRLPFYTFSLCPCSWTFAPVAVVCLSSCKSLSLFLQSLYLRALERAFKLPRLALLVGLHCCPSLFRLFYLVIHDLTVQFSCKSLCAELHGLLDLRSVSCSFSTITRPLTPTSRLGF